MLALNTPTPFTQTRSWSGQPPATRAIPMDVARTDNAVTIWLDLPGLDSDAVDLTVENRVLTITAERAEPRSEGGRFISRERRTGKLRRQVVLGEELDGSKISAEMEAGVLEVTIPVAELAKPHRIEIGKSAEN